MKDQTIKILSVRLAEVNTFIDEHQESLDCVLKQPRSYQRGADEILSDKIRIAKKERTEIINCIDWINKKTD